MLSPACLVRLATLPPQSCTRACLLLSSFDLSRSLRLQPGLLDRRWDWPAGTAARLLLALLAAQVLVQRGGGVSAAAASKAVTVRLAPECLATAAALAAWQAGLEAAAARESLALQ